MMKNIAAGIAGALVAVGLVWLVETIGHSVYPPPPDLNLSDAEAMRSYVLALPLGAFLFVGGAWFIGTLGGTMTACRIGKAQPLPFAVLIGGLMLLATAANLVMIPHPLWFSISGIFGIIAAAWLGMILSRASSSA